MSDPAVAWLFDKRRHTCGKCRRPVQRATSTRASGGWTIDVWCHGQHDRALVTLSYAEDNRRCTWFRDVLVHARIDRHGRIDVGDDGGIT